MRKVEALTSGQYNLRLALILALAVAITVVLRRLNQQPAYSSQPHLSTSTSTAARSLSESLHSCLPPSPLPPLTLLTLHDGPVTLWSSTPRPPYLFLLYTPFTHASTALFAELPALLQKLSLPFTVLLLSYGHSTLGDATIGASHLKDMYAFDSRLPASPHVHLARTHPLDPSTWLSALLECDTAPSALLPFATLRNFNRTADHVRLMEAQQPGLPSLLSLPPHRAYLLYYVEAVHGACPFGSVSAEELPEEDAPAVKSDFPTQPPTAPFLLLTPVGACTWLEKAAYARSIGAAGLLLHPRERSGRATALSCAGKECREAADSAVGVAMVEWEDAHVMWEMSLDVVGLTVTVGALRVGVHALGLGEDGGWWADAGDEESGGGVLAPFRRMDALQQSAAAAAAASTWRRPVVLLVVFALSALLAVCCAARALYWRATSTAIRRPAVRAGTAAAASSHAPLHPGAGVQRRGVEARFRVDDGSVDAEAEEDDSEATALLLDPSNAGY